MSRIASFYSLNIFQTVYMLIQIKSGMERNLVALRWESTFNMKIKLQSSGRIFPLISE